MGKVGVITNAERVVGLLVSTTANLKKKAPNQIKSWGCGMGEAGVVTITDRALRLLPSTTAKKNLVSKV